MAKLYVINTDRTPWVLNLDGGDRLACNGSISWQRVGERNESGPPSRWEICERAGPDTFTTETGETLTCDRGPYTVEAWANFLATWKG